MDCCLSVTFPDHYEESYAFAIKVNSNKTPPMTTPIIPLLGASYATATSVSCSWTASNALQSNGDDYVLDQGHGAMAAYPFLLYQELKQRSAAVMVL